jgi:L-threonylcarbamoyladenylate synthase
VSILQIITEEEFISGVKDTEVQNWLLNGGIVIFPSENSYGFAGNALSERVCDRIHFVKKEDSDKPIGLITDSVEKIQDLVDFEKQGKVLLEKVFSGPLTILFRTKKSFPFSLNGFAGIRIPQRKSLLHLCSLVDFPLTAPSANIHGESAIYNSEKMKEIFGLENFLLIDAGQLDENALPSTYYNFETKEIIREGKVKLEEIKEFLKE